MHPDAQGTASLSPAHRVDLASRGTPGQRSGVTTPLLALLTATLLALGSPASGWIPPLTTGWEQVLRAFERPDDRFAAGHRGIDVAAPPGAEVRAIGPGRVAFVGDVARTPTVSIEHGLNRGRRRTSRSRPSWPKATGWRWAPSSATSPHTASTAHAAAFTSGFDGPRGRPAMP